MTIENKVGWWLRENKQVCKGTKWCLHECITMLELEAVLCYHCCRILHAFLWYYCCNRDVL